MKSVKAFLLLMCAQYAGVFMFAWLKSTVFVADRYLFLIRYQSLFVIITGILIMKLTLQKQAFIFFIVLYTITWVIYFILKFYLIVGGGEPANNMLPLDPALGAYLTFTQLLTPFPFLVFWLLNRVYRLHFSGKEKTKNKQINYMID
jgi:hypothetical protein